MSEEVKLVPLPEEEPLDEGHVDVVPGPGVVVLERVDGGHDHAQEAHLQEQRVPLEVEEGVRRVEDGEVAVPEDKERHLVAKSRITKTCQNKGAETKSWF